MACSCRVRDICTRVEEVPVIFLGEVIEGGIEPGKDLWDGTASFAKLRVIEAFRGLPADTHEVTVQLQFMRGMCSPTPYRRGDRTLVFVSRDDQGNLHDGGCTESSLGKWAEKDLEYIRSYFHGKTTTTIRGHIGANSESSMVDYTLSSGGYPVAGALVTAEDAGKKYTAKSDAGGGYEIPNLPPGAYSVHAELAGYIIRESDFNVSVSPRGCVIQDLGLWSSASVRGFVFDPTGSPVRGLKIFLQKDGQKEKFGEESKTGLEGEFAFDEIDPGTYTLIVSPAGATADSPYERHIHPERILITPTSKLDGYSVQVPAPIATRSIRVRITWPDGKPVDYASLLCSQFGATEYPQSYGVGSKAGVATCPALADRAYQIRLERVGPRGSPRLLDAPQAMVPPSSTDVELNFKVSPRDAEGLLKSAATTSPRP